MLKRTNLIWEVPCHICLPKMHTLHPLPLLCSILEDRKIKDNQERTCATKRSFEDLKLDRKRGGGRVGCSQIWDFSYCPNMYLLKENLCPAELPMRQPGERSSGNRTCPYREGSWGERQHEGAGVKCFPRIWPFHWCEPSEIKPPQVPPDWQPKGLLWAWLSRDS